MPQTLGFGIRLDQINLLCTAPGKTQVAQGHLINGEHGRSRAKLGAHVANGCPVGQWDTSYTGSIELHELAHHAVLTKHLGNGQHHVCCGNSSGDFPGELETDNAGNEHRHGLTQHGGFGFNTANSPAQNAQPIDHGGVGVSSHTSVGEGLNHTIDVLGVGHLGKVFNIDLVHNSGARRYHLEVIECGLTPAKELVALAIAFILNVDISGEGVRLSKQIGNHRVINHEFCWREGVDLLRVPAQVDNGLAHRGEIDDAGNTGEVLQNHASGSELNFSGGLSGVIPIPHRRDLLLGDVGAIFGAQQVFQQDLEAKGQRLVTRNSIDTEDFVVTLPHAQGVTCRKTIERGHFGS